MGIVVGIACIIHTGAVPHARTDGSVYLGLGGREFGLDSPTLDDFELGSQFVYVLGSASGFGIPGIHVTVAQRDRNDPGLGFPIDTEAVLNLPRYIRFEPEDSDDEWNLTYAEARVHIEEARPPTRTILRFSVPVLIDAKKRTFIDLWLSNQTGKIAHLSRPIP